MDRTTETIVEFVDRLDARDLSENVIHAGKRLLVDTFGCAIGGIESPPAAIARAMAADVTGSFQATVFGMPGATTADMAAFANTTMVRYLDYNDMYFAPKGGGAHPSDLIPTALAVGEAVGSSGQDVLTAIVAGYEVLGILCGAGTIRLRERGWDQGLYTIVAAAMIAGKLFGLTRDELANALSLAITPHVPTRHTRVGELSMWKGCATADTARNGIFAAMLARRGMTGPPKPFEGGHAIFEQVTGPYEISMAVRPPAFVIEHVCTKYWPVEYNAQGLVDLALRMRGLIVYEDIASINVETYWLAYSEIGSQPEKWDPRTRETADHSIPYILAVALRDGSVSEESFTPDHYRDPELLALMKNISVSEVTDFSDRFPRELLIRITIRAADGASVTDEIAHPRGHAKNPMTDDEINTKFDGLIGRLRPADIEVCRKLRSSWWSLDTIGDIAPLLAPLRDIQLAGPPQ